MVKVDISQIIEHVGGIQPFSVVVTPREIGENEPWVEGDISVTGQIVNVGTVFRLTGFVSAQATLEVADLKPFVPELAGQPLTARLDAQGVLTRVQGQGEVSATLPELGPATLRFTAAGDEQAVQLDELRLTTAHRPLTLTVKGDVQFAELRFNASGQWQALVWPLTGPPQVESSKGEFTVQGTPLASKMALSPLKCAKDSSPR